MSALRDRIARAIYTSKEFAAAAAFGVPIDAKTVCAEGIADAVIEALGLREELGSKSHGTGLIDCGATPGPDILGRHNYRRYVTDWKEKDDD